MGLATELGYRHRPPNAFQRLNQRLGATRPGAWTFSKALPPLDRIVHRVSKGATSLPAVLAGLPVLMVTTTGRRSGAPRLTPLISVPVGDDLALLGTNFGQSRTPAWVHNLEADPHATVEFRGRAVAATARPATDAERASVWAASASIYGGYGTYQQRVTDREIRIFVLEATRPPERS
ncbi:MAG: nitroreductase family deazaflavin-dependent oxidoreductase [Acidimicrobiales bacterium]|jgi:deazaflavin-dependent oxidoreductase (nitroreductase family)|nr:nitroreductase family deazaflavin-dependent oxidoreductase [Acidimicrobiales bacterium]